MKISLIIIHIISKMKSFIHWCELVGLEISKVSYFKNS